MTYNATTRWHKPLVWGVLCLALLAGAMLPVLLHQMPTVVPEQFLHTLFSSYSQEVATLLAQDDFEDANLWFAQNYSGFFTNDGFVAALDGGVFLLPYEYRQATGETLTLLDMELRLLSLGQRQYTVRLLCTDSVGAQVEYRAAMTLAQYAGTWRIDALEWQSA